MSTLNRMKSLAHNFILFPSLTVIGQPQDLGHHFTVVLRKLQCQMQFVTEKRLYKFFWDG